MNRIHPRPQLDDNPNLPTTENLITQPSRNQARNIRPILNNQPSPKKFLIKTTLNYILFSSYCLLILQLIKNKIQVNIMFFILFLVDSAIITISLKTNTIEGQRFTILGRYIFEFIAMITADSQNLTYSTLVLLIFIFGDCFEGCSKTNSVSFNPILEILY